MILYGIKVAVKYFYENIKFLEKEVKETIPIPETVSFEIEDIISVIKEKLNCYGIDISQEQDYFVISTLFPINKNEESKQEFFKKIDNIICACLGEEIFKNGIHIVKEV